MVPIRGNVDTRIGKLKAGEYDAVILAYAGVKRAGLWEEGVMMPMAVETMVPAAGQGALALQCRRGDERVRGILGRLNDAGTAGAVAVEREVVRLLEGDCHSPIGAYAEWGEEVHVRVCVGGAGGCAAGVAGGGAGGGERGGGGGGEGGGDVAAAGLCGVTGVFGWAF